MTPVTLQFDELIVDSFAGGGGASEGIRLALGRDPDIAINHDAEAIAMHEANHPGTRHYTEDVWQVDPFEATQGKPVGLMWLSPDCKHFSKAKGGKPVSKKVRGLAWVAVRWAKAVQPRVIVLENVEEFQTWGPLGDDGKPCKRRKGVTFKRFVGRLRNLGYEVQWRELRAADYGTPTTRKRLFIIARRDGQPIRWPEPTHGKGRAQPWRTAAECIDWSDPCPSIFDRKRPLAENTLRRIAAGIRRFVIESPKPFVVTMRGTEDHHIDRSAAGVDEPIRTISGGGTHAALVTPFLATYYSAKHTGDDRTDNLELPLPTQSCENRFGLVAPTLVQTGYGERDGQAPRALDLHKPLGTVVGCGQKHGLVASYLARHYTGVEGRSLFEPVPTVTAVDHHSLVHAFLVAYFGNEKDGGSVNDPMRTITARDRFGLVTVAGEEYQIADIGMRMLQPRELYRAQGFRPDYKIEIPFPYRSKKTGKVRVKPLTKTAQVRMVGNSVCPPLARAIVAANVPEMISHQAAA